MDNLPYIIFNGTSSLDFDVIVANQSKYESPSNDMEQIEVMGRDGVLLSDNDRMNPVKRPFPFSIRVPQDSEETIVLREERMSSWLGVKGFKDLELSWDKEYIYKAAVIEGFDVTETTRKFGKGVINFLMHPIKYNKGGQSFVDVPNGETLFNPNNKNAQPTFILKGTGNVTVTVGSQKLVLRNVTNGITIDMEKKNVTYLNQSQYDRMYSDFIYLSPGNNTITWDNDDFTLRVKPNWGVRI
ncbi:phage distal tail protein [Facklamia sp. 7083-14-GEN3]|uniref:phage distal tail protein n=1 Tax=Facklamia sp. 7083-14-GEN3 TaxID=2973478 RepID=UPI00215C1E07|nr:phage tail protein [Facklamia sp. 7083-14-GEN3]MCR8969269.1 phage tail protein [Facklamia sp. 7083-14-GEN3]